MEETVAVLGTGKMGTALVRAFAAAGHGVVAWNRSLARAEPSGNPRSRSTAVLTTRRCDDERRGTRF
jgi:3-hydroxyisobutyrate dehydrogenase-like beta-hydroxyacid dehydrogenase